MGLFEDINVHLASLGHRRGRSWMRSIIGRAVVDEEPLAENLIRRCTIDE